MDLTQFTIAGYHEVYHEGKDQSFNSKRKGVG